jgi:hypothetical protein
MKQAIKSPAIDIDMLTMALQAGDLDTGWWLDTYSGNVIPAPEENEDSVEQQLLEESRRDPSRYLVIEPIAESILLELMESFIATLEEEVLCEQLYDALKKKQPVWHFKNTLSSMPEYEDDWYAFKEQFYALQARQWLRDRVLDYKEVGAGVAEEDIRPKPAPAPDAGMMILLELRVEHGSEHRRYIVWQQETELVLTLFSEQSEQQQQLLAEVSINRHQLGGINHILETYRPYIDTNFNEQSFSVHMIYNNTGFRGELQGGLNNEPFHSLLTTLDMLLGVPLIKA